MTKKTIAVLMMAIFLIAGFSINLFAGEEANTQAQTGQTNQTQEEQRVSRFPYELKWAQDVIIPSVGATLFFTQFFIKKKSLTYFEATTADRNSVNSFDRPATYNYSESISKTSDWIVAGLISAPVIFSVSSMLAGRDNVTEMFKLLFLYGESVILTLGISGFVKALVDRKRPFVYNENAPVDKKMEKDSIRSFYSSHTSQAFNSAIFFSMVITHYYPNHWINWVVWPLSVGTATLVGILRYKAGKHFPSDIIVGGAAGIATGLFIPLLHKKSERRTSLLPLFGEYKGVCLIHSF